MSKQDKIMMSFEISLITLMFAIPLLLQPTTSHRERVADQKIYKSKGDINYDVPRM